MQVKGKTTTLRISKIVKNKSINNDGYRNMIKKQLWFLQNNFNIMIEQEVYMLGFFCLFEIIPIKSNSLRNCWESLLNA